MADNMFEAVDILDTVNVNHRDSDSSSNHEDLERCVQLQLPEHIAAHQGGRELVRDIEPIKCDNTLVDKVCNNYIIAKKILSNLPWQEKLLCKHVCTTWNSAIIALNREQMHPSDFVVEISFRSGIRFKESSIFPTEPLVVFTFSNTTGFIVNTKCMALLPHPCDPPCEQKHCILDLVQQKVCGHKNCMFTVKSCDLSYLPLPQSPTYKNALTNQMFERSRPFVGGIFIPQIPDVKFHVINIKSNNEMQTSFFEQVRELSKDRIFKGVLVYVTEKFLLHSVEDFEYLNYFKDVQPDVPYALGGCIIEDAMTDKNDIKHVVDCVNEGTDFISENLISIGIFSVPKDVSKTEDKYNFEMYSFVIDSSNWNKAQIQKTIKEFSKKVPQFEHRVALKLSCVGRDKKHEIEQNYFRAAFPGTRLIGCYGNGELGINHPACPVVETLPTAKRHRRDPGPQCGIIYSYSTVFVYIAWGKKNPL